MKFLVAYLFWPYLYHYFKKIYGSNSIARNLVGLIDTVGCIGFSAMDYYYDVNYSWYLSLMFPFFYYLWDINYIFLISYEKDKWYIFHHLIAIYIIVEILQGPESFQVLVYPMLMAAELSNIPLHFTYHILKTRPQQRLFIFSCKIIHCLIFFLIRIVYYSYLVFTVAPMLLPNWMFVLSLLSIYVAGLTWFHRQLGSLGRDYLEFYKN